MTGRRPKVDARTRCALLLKVLLLVVLSTGLPARTAAQTPDAPLLTGSVHEAPVSSFDLEHLRLAVRFDEDRRQVFGDATLRLAPLDTLADTLVLFVAGLAIDSVQFGAPDSVKVDVPFRVGQADSLLIALDTLRVRAAPFEVRLVYNAQPRRGLYFIQPDKDNPNQKRQIWTTSAPEECRHWFPVVEALGDTFTSDLLVTVAEPLRVLSGGRLVDEITNANGTRTVHYAQDQPHAPHHLLLAVGEYEVVRETARASVGAPVLLSYWIYPEQRDDAARTFGRTPDLMRFFVEHLRTPFPWASYAQVVLPPLHDVGMEKTGAAALSDRVVIDERAALDTSPDRLIARELAHQWFGGLVPARYWTDVWLNEGAAAYLSALAEEHQTDEGTLGLRMLDYADGYLVETRRYHRPLVWNRWVDPFEMFDAHSSLKGAWVLHMLHRRVGEAAFWKILEQHLATYAHKPADTADFQRVVRSVTGGRWEDFFAQWVEAAGHPVLNVRYAYDASEGLLSVTVEQVQDGSRVPDVFTTPLTLEVHALTEAFRFDVNLDERRQTFALPLTMRPRFLLVDPDGDLLAEVHVDQSARAWVGQLRYAPDAVSRIRAARALETITDDPALLVGLRSALPEEPSAAVRLAIVETMSRLPASSATQRALTEALEDENAAVRSAVLDALGAYANEPEIHNLAFQAAQNDPSYRVQAAAVKTLARTASPAALGVIQSALITPSHREVIRQAAFEALALLDEPPRDGLALGLEYSEPHQPGDVRVAALRYLQTLAPNARAALNRLIDLLEDDDDTIRRAAIESLAALDTERARAALERRRATEPQPPLKALFEKALEQNL